MQLLPCGCNKGTSPGGGEVAGGKCYSPLPAYELLKLEAKEVERFMFLLLTKTCGVFSYLNHQKFIETNAAILFYPEGFPFNCLFFFKSCLLTC